MLLDDMGDLLTSGSVGAVGTDIFLGFMPPAPDAALAIYETGGLAPIHAMNPNAGNVVEQPRIQLVARAGQYDYASARTKIHAAFKLLDGMPTRLINNVPYKWAAAVQSPFMMGRDETGRVLLACNFDVVKEMTP